MMGVADYAEPAGIFDANTEFVYVGPDDIISSPGRGAGRGGVFADLPTHGGGLRCLGSARRRRRRGWEDHRVG
jgi:hypothetical protein